jgi:hypothetical protein
MESLETVFLEILWKMQNMSFRQGNQTKKDFKSKSTTWLILIAYNKRREQNMLNI